jgi:ATP-binding cassette, subfamily B, multidrug efflux pump
MTKEHQSETHHYLWELRPYFRQVAGALTLGSLAGIVMNTTVVLPALLLGHAIDTALALQRGEATASAVVRAALLLFGGTMLSEGPRMLKRWWLGTANARIRSNLRADAVRGILSRPLAELHGIPIGDLMARTPTLCASSSSRPETRSSSPSPLSSPYLQSTGPRHRGIFKH